MMPTLFPSGTRQERDSLMALDIAQNNKVAPVRSTIQCTKCGSDYEGLACPSCARQWSIKWMRDRMALSLKEKNVSTYWTRSGHLTLGDTSWRRILRDLGLKPNADLVIPTVCGEPVMWNDLSDMKQDSSADGLALYFKVEEFKKCQGCAK
jgi:hypothetical protein